MSAAASESLYYIRVRGKVEGPYNLPQAQALVRRGRLGRHHEVSQDRVNWKRASEFPELFATPMPRHPQNAAAPPPPAESSEVPSATPQNWYYAQDGTEQGPVSLEELRQLLHSGALNADTLVWTEGLSQWTPWLEVPELNPALSAKQPPPTAVVATSPSSATPAAPPASICPQSVASFGLSIAFVSALGVTCALVLSFSERIALAILITSGAGGMFSAVLGYSALHNIKRGSMFGSKMAVAGMVLGALGLVLSTVCLILLKDRLFLI